MSLADLFTPAPYLPIRMPPLDKNAEMARLYKYMLKYNVPQHYAEQVEKRFDANQNFGITKSPISILHEIIGMEVVEGHK